MTLKDKINKISAIGLISSAAIIASGYIFENKELFGFVIKYQQVMKKVTKTKIIY